MPHAENEKAPSSLLGNVLLSMFALFLIFAVVAVVVPKIAGRGAAARIAMTKSALANLSAALAAFELHAGRLPTTTEGLNALCARPGGLKGPYIPKSASPPDAWGSAYAYCSPGAHGAKFDLISPGPDRTLGTPDDL